MLIGILWFFLMVCGIYMIATRSTHSDRSRVFFGAFALISSYALLQKMFFIFKEVDMQDYYYVIKAYLNNQEYFVQDGKAM